MNTYETNLKSAGRIAGLLLAVVSGPVFGQAHVPPRGLPAQRRHGRSAPAPPARPRDMYLAEPTSPWEAGR
jgi:hypothetical protein